jgi:hypothetical protein
LIPCWWSSSLAFPVPLLEPKCCPWTPFWGPGPVTQAQVSQIMTLLPSSWFVKPLCEKSLLEPGACPWYPRTLCHVNLWLTWALWTLNLTNPISPCFMVVDPMSSFYRRPESWTNNHKMPDSSTLSSFCYLHN